MKSSSNKDCNTAISKFSADFSLSLVFHIKITNFDFESIEQTVTSIMK